MAREVRDYILFRLDKINDTLNQLISTVLSLEEKMTDFSKIEAEVAQNTDAVNAAVELLENLSDLIRAAGTDPIKLNELATALDANTRRLAEAVAANTPAAP